MAKWVVTPGVKDHNMTGGIEYDGAKGTSQWKVQQDIGRFLDEAKMDREAGDSNTHYRKAFSIPAIVAIDIKEKFGLDIYDPGFMHDREGKAKLFAIVERHYPNLKSTESRLI